MNTAQAKKIPLTQILSKFGMEPVKSFKGGIELAYVSPFRKEKEPSLFVNIRKNLWNDFGDMGGNALDFVIRYCNTDVKGALEILDRYFGDTSRAGTLPLPLKKTEKQKGGEEEKEEGTFLLDSVSPLGAGTPTLVSYITQTRKINPAIASYYLKEIHFHNRFNGRKYFAVGFINMSGGYEIRNPFFKSSIGAKNMSFVEGTGQGAEIWIFEGFIDFLSKLTLEKSSLVPKADCLILNSVSYTEKAVAFLKSKNYQTIYGYLDNDKAGDEATAQLRSAFAEQFQDRRKEYETLKDLNEHLLK